MMKQDEFVGREWLFDDIDSWITRDLEANESRAFVIWGAAGTGKTSFAREFVRRHKERKLVAYHFFEKDNPLTYHVQTIVLDLQKVLKKNLPGYAASFIPGDKLRTQPEKLFSTLITEPLQKLPENDKMFLLVDALDESDSTASSCFIKLSTNLPQWLRILFTSRHDVTELSNHFQDSCFASLDDFKSSPQTLLSLTEDIREFVATKYTKLQGEYPNTIPPFFANNDQAAKEKVVEASHNCFLYAKLVMEHIFAGHDDIGLPRSLFDLYDLDFERRFADVKFFQKKIAPVIEVILAIVSCSVKLHEDGLRDNILLSMISPSFDFSCYSEDEERLVSVVNEGHLAPGFSRRDLDKALELLSAYLIKTASGCYQFTHSSVSDWFNAQEKTSNFFCDVTKGHSIMASSMLKTLKRKLPPDDEVAFRNSVDVYSRLLVEKFFFIRYLYHSSFLPEREASGVNTLLSELGIKEMNLLVAVSGMRMGGPSPAPIYTPSEYLTMRILDETDVLFSMHSLQIETFFKQAIEANCASVLEKFFNFSSWLFSPKVLSAISDAGPFEQLVELILKNGLAPQLFFSLLCCKDIVLAFSFLVRFCCDYGVTADICVPTICQNTKKLKQSVCWNEDVQEYFRRLKADERNVITLESLKYMPLCPKEANVDGFTLKMIRDEPLSKIESLVRDGKCFIQFKYAWHEYFKNNRTSLKVVEYLLKHGANVNNRGSSGVTALMYACQQQDLRLVSFFLEAGADVNQQNFFGSTALHYAVKSGDDDSKVAQEVIEKLLQHKADPTLKNFLNVSAVDLAKKKKKMALHKLMVDQATNQE